MNDHARKVWHAWVDGKTVQSRTAVSKEDWSDANPTHTSVDPQTFPALWRVKPDTQVIRYRVFMMDCGDDIRPVIHQRKGKYDTDADMENMDGFVCWDGEEHTTVVEVEE